MRVDLEVSLRRESPGVKYSSLTLEQGVSLSADENTRRAQSAYDAFGRGGVAALAGVMADDIEWVNPGDPADDPNVKG